MADIAHKMVIKYIKQGGRGGREGGREGGGGEGEGGGGTGLGD